MYISYRGLPWRLRNKEYAYSARDTGDASLIPGSALSPGGGNGKTLQYPCQDKFHGQRSLAGYSPWIVKSQTWLSMHTYISCILNFLCRFRFSSKGFPHSSVNKESACNSWDPGSTPGLGRSPGEGNGNPFQYSCLENPMDWGAWRAIVRGVARVGHNLATEPPQIFI